MPLVDPVTMASTPTKPTTATAAAAALQPVPIQQTPAGQAGRYVHPVVLLALFGSQFNALVTDPVRVLVTTLPIVAAVQVAYVSLCLPAAGSQDAKPARKARPGEKKKQDGSGPNPVIALFLSLLMTALVTPALHLAFVLFGAPFLTHIPHTLLLSTNLALLALFPLFYVHGVEASAWLAIGSAMAPWDETFGGLAGALFGAWLGAVPIPLDWDREWQKWPVTILYGLYAGYVAGKVTGGFLLFGKRMVSRVERDDKEE
ncbi:hypothetical protein VD0002_g6568 [Verticillium dahliae]|uniref:Glycosylphosphatidylinositol anchor biosynthesis protein n=2 Tax=Verticillium dahliae TaxID=27337 RepID=G2WRW5_VERDV|nr:glycosylphosphatidylinositol anchor biosynthesis protein [Verticillium dahliae VdLs.17]KAF3344321.1 Nascent polypeptide-associated complex subunit beta [Verticillium dahliae VDG2]KAH6710070.1 glycosylphosphatidylinositol anchor biosynthesis protein [Verticillium dahliae]EGY13616.1 glycosylphosphatidylinositol anchor biosynthesis protein [Verticillium dahliae VdLs.17]PNH34307.1 hypothetical protein BJF96_g2559 [Verticillium dahliae]PNH55358.1 hypothetical protein VD0003_g2267 [Verticillium d